MFSLFHELIEQLFETASVLSSLNLIVPFGIKARFLEDERFPILSFSIEQETRLEGFHLSNIIPFVSMQFFNFNRFDFTNIYSLFQLFSLSLFGKFRRSFVIHFSRRKKWRELEGYGRRWVGYHFWNRRFVESAVVGAGWRLEGICRSVVRAGCLTKRQRSLSPSRCYVRRDLDPEISSRSLFTRIVSPPVDGEGGGGLSISTYELIDRDQEMAVEKKILLELFELKLRRCSEFSIVAIFR